MSFVDTIYLSWRKTRGDNRLLIGMLKRTDNGFSFQYIKDNYQVAKKEGFLNYPEFADFDKLYTDYLKEIFSFRLIPQTRPERQNFLDFWAVPKNADWFDELAFTQGKLTSDTFEFLGIFLPGRVNVFVTDIAGLSHHDCVVDDLNDDDGLLYKVVPMEHAFHKEAVEVRNIKNKKVGYVKQVHNYFFSAASNKIRTFRVKHVVKNGVLKECYAEVRL